MKGKDDPMTPVKGGAFNVPEGKGGFGFRSGLAMQGRRILNGLTGKKTAPATPVAPATPAVAETPATPSVKKEEKKEELELEIPRGSQTEPRPKRKKRFEDIHRQQFAKMEGIDNHYAAKRVITSVTPNAPKSVAPEVTPKNAPLTPEMAPKGIKRTKSQAVLGDREPPSSPSPVKRRPDIDNESGHEEERSPVKRQKLDSNTITLERKSKIARLAAGSSTPMKRPTLRSTAAPATVGALNRNMALKAPSSKRAMPALPKPSPAFNLTPSTTLSTPSVTAPAPSKIPTTPGRAPLLQHPHHAPATIGASKLNTMINFAEASTTISTPAKSAAERPAPTTVGGFTFRSRRGPSGLGFGALSEIHDKKKATMEMPRFESKMGTPKIRENDPVGVEDPFAERMDVVETPVAKGRKRKNEVEHSRDDRDSGKEVVKIIEKEEAMLEEEEEEEPEKMEHSEKEEPKEKKPVREPPTPARKRLRFDTPNGKEQVSTPVKPPAKEKTLAEAVAKANNRRKRLNFLATPKKRVAGEGDKLGSKSMWK